MLIGFKGFFSHLRGNIFRPNAPDHAQGQVRTVLTVISWLSLVIIPIGLLAAFLVSPNEIKQPLIIATSMEAIWLCVLYATRRGRDKLASYLAVTCLWLILSTQAVLAGGIHSAAFIGYFPIIILAGMLLGEKAIFFVMGASIVFGMGLTFWSEPLGISTPIYRSPEPVYWIAVSIFMIMLALLQFYSQWFARKSMQQAQTKETERAKIERILNQSQNRFATLFEYGPVPKTLTRVSDDRLLDVNLAWRELWGVDREEAVGKTAVEIGLWVNPKDREHLLEQLHGQDRITDFKTILRSRTKGDRHVSIAVRKVDFGGEDCMIIQTSDITTLKQAEDEIRQARELFQSIFMFSPVAFALIDSANQVMDVNTAWEKLFGYEKAEIVSRSALDVIPMLSREGTSLLQVFASIIQTGSLLDYEFEFTTKNGDTGWASAYAKMIDLNEKFMLVEFVDITARKLAENISQEHRQKINQLMDVLPVGISILDENSKVVFNNPALLNILKTTEAGIENGEYRQRTYLNSDSLPMPADGFASAQARTSRKPVHNIETGVTLEDGEIVWLNVSAVPMNFRDWKTLIVSTDMTARKNDLQELQRSERLLNEMGRMAMIGGWELDVASMKQIWTDETYAIHDRERDSYDPNSTEELSRFEPGSKELIQAAFNDALQDGTPYDLEVEMSTIKGNRKWVRAVCIPLIRDGKVIKLTGALQDITHRKRMENELRRSNSELEQFAYVASHDLQEPLRTVAGMVQLLQKRYQGQLDERADEYVAHAVEGSARMQTLIRDLLEYSRVERRNQPIQPISAQDCLQTALKNLDAAITESQAVISIDPLPTVQADASQLTQLFQNLIGNSIKFSGAQEPHIRINVTQVDAAWQFAIQDNGIGIEPQYFERIFLIFQRLHTRREYQGTGIGLALCKKIVERHGGSIWVESLPGNGSTFYFTLPIRSTDHD